MTDDSQNNHEHQDPKKNSQHDDDATLSWDGIKKNQAEGFPDKIGQYQLVRKIASGGMGTVFEALQEHPRRPVALKVVKNSFLSESAVQRFEYEAQLLARLRHPGIAQIYETGSFEDNGVETPFFAMEYIPNAKSIVEYVHQKNLSHKEILCLFQQVCEAIHHGHQRGIVHRDLKPSNILVDSNGRVRVIDFGVAKSTDSDMREAASHTKVGQIVGSVQYMSPEQFEADPHDIDTRSDIYALGLVLFELFSGRLPYKTSSDQIFDFAAEVRTGTLQSLSSVDKEIDREIEAIVNKALKKDRDERYQSAYGLESDIKRFLNGDAISAETNRLSYQFKVFSRKNKLVMGLVAAVFVLLISGVAITTNLYLTVDQERNRAELAMMKADKGQKFLTDILATSASECFGSDFSGETLLDSASIKLARAFPDDPMVEIEIRRSIGKAYIGLGKFQKAIGEREKAYNLIKDDYDIENDTMEEVFDELVTAYGILGDKESKLNLERDYLNKVISQYGVSSLETYATKFHIIDDLEQNGFISEAKLMAQEAWIGIVDEYGLDSTFTLYSQFKYGWMLVKSGDIEQASKLIHEAYEKVNSSYDAKHNIHSFAKSCMAALYIVESKIDSAQFLYGNLKIPTDLGVEYSFNGELKFSKNSFQLLVFFETWCPYSKNAMGHLGKVDKHYKDNGLDIFGFVEGTRNTKLEEIEPYLNNLDVDFAVFKEDGTCGDFFEVGGYPAIRLVSNGYLIWEKKWFTSDYISPQMLDGIVTAQYSTPFKEGTF